jgi:hypothetical protein
LALFPLILGLDKAHAASGLHLNAYNCGYQYNQSPPEGCNTSPVYLGVVPYIDFQDGSGGPIGVSEDYQYNWSGYIKETQGQTVYFRACSDDGMRIYINGQLIVNDWFDRGGQCGNYATYQMSSNNWVPINVWFYENGGGSAGSLQWNLGSGWTVVPSSSFSTEYVAPVVVKTIGAPRNLTVVDSATATTLSWEAPNTGNTQPERYAISFTTEGQNGWGIATGNVGDANALNTTITINHSLLESLMPSGTVWSFHIRSDNDTFALYSENSNVVTLKIGKTQAEKDAEAAAAIAAQQELDRQSAANTAVTNYENQPITTLSEVSIAESLKLLADTATATVLNQNIKISLQSRIDIKQSVVSSAKASLIQAKLEADAAALIAQQAAEAQAEAARQAALAAEVARVEAERQAALAEAARIAAEQEAARQAALAAQAEADRVAAEIAAAKAEADRIAAEEAAAKAEADRLAAEEAAAKAEADRIKAEEEAEKARAEAEAKAEADAKAEAERLEAEAEAIKQAEEDAKAEAEAKKAEEEAAKQAEEDAKAEAEAKAKELEEEKAAEEEAKAEEEKLNEIIEDAKDGKELTEEQKEVVVTALLENLKPGESISAAEVKASGVSYADLPAETPVEVRTDENGNALVITAEVAANVELVQDPGALLEAAFTDPGAALAALGSIGADMTEEEREEAKDMVVATVVATGAALNAVGLATGGSAPAAPSGGASSGTNSGGSRRNEKW